MPLPSCRLRDVLAEKERECQALVHQALHRVQTETRVHALASETPGEQTRLGNGEGKAAGNTLAFLIVCLFTASLPKDQSLVQWLQELSVDPATIQTVSEWGLSPPTNQRQVLCLPAIQIFSPLQ